MGTWTDLEHSKFVEAIRLYRNDWMKVSEMVCTRDKKQCQGYSYRIIKAYDKEPGNLEDDFVSILKSFTKTQYERYHKNPHEYDMIESGPISNRTRN